MKEEKAINLVSLVKNQHATILAITAGAKTAKRLADLGVTPNTQIKILRKATLQGPIEIEIRGSSLVLGKGIVSKILVKQT
jgi:DtxR family transcriptional regulator, Mn-dependent transcriptional regulator